MPARRLALLTAAAVLVTVPAAHGAAPPPPFGNGTLRVYDANVENLPANPNHPKADCRGDWPRLVESMRDFKPDVFTVQQVDGPGQAGQLAQRMTLMAGVPYAVLVASPKPRVGDFPCKPRKNRQTNAIIYNTDRLTPVAGSARTWHPRSGKGCGFNKQPRTKTISAVFNDIARPKAKRVYVASIHWPSNARNVQGHRCVAENVKRTITKATAQPAALRIVGGDVNIDVKKPWYGTLAPFVDAVTPPAGDRTRRDVLLAMRKDGAPGVLTGGMEIGWKVPAHRAIRAVAHYPGG